MDDLDIRPGQVWERTDGDHHGHRLLVTRVNSRHIKARTVGLAARAPNRGSEGQKISVPLDELERHYALFQDARRKPLMTLTAQAEIDRIRREGIPPAGTPERGRYLSLLSQVNRRPPGELDEVDHLMMRLYVDSDVQINAIHKALGVDQNRLSRAKKILHIPNREEMTPWRPSARIVAGEGLVVIGGEAMFRNETTGLMRAVFPKEAAINLILDEPAEEVADFEPVPEQANNNGVEPEVTSSGKRIYKPRRRLQPNVEAEIVRLYEDLSIPTEEILAAYSLPSGSLYRVLHKHGVTVRSKRPGYEYARYKAQQMHLGEAPGAQEEPVATAAEGNVESNVSALVLPTPPAMQIDRQRAWAVSYVFTRVEIVAAPTFEEAVRLIREHRGQDIDITSIQRT